MYKNQVALTILAILQLGGALAKEVQPKHFSYKVISSQFDKTIPVDSCVLYGTVHYPDGTNQFNREAYIVNSSTGVYTPVVNGRYKLTIASENTFIYFYSPYFREIVLKDFDYQAQHSVEIDFYTGPHEMEAPIQLEKPIIYLYSDEEKDLEITLKPIGPLVFTYPLYDKNWSVHVSPINGISAYNRTYPYLFWEGEQIGLSFKPNTLNRISGFQLQSDTLVSFLERQLNAIGLNEKESTDFITYWAPRMIKHDKLALQFFIDDAYEQYIGDVLVSPAPQSQKRVYLIFKGIQSFDEIKFGEEPVFPKFERNGLTLIEWGGSEVR